LVPYREAPVAVADVELLDTVVTQAFSQRRKTLRNTLKPLLDAERMEQLGIDPTRRAETLSLAEFATLTNAVGDEDEAV